MMRRDAGEFLDPLSRLSATEPPRQAQLLLQDRCISRPGWNRGSRSPQERVATTSTVISASTNLTGHRATEAAITDGKKPEHAAEETAFAYHDTAVEGASCKCLIEDG